MSEARKALRTGFFLLQFTLLFGACSAPRLDINTPEGRKAIKEAVKIALTSYDCASALQLIEPLYNSQYTDNETRILRASAHACNARVKFFTVMEDLASTATGSGLSGTVLWKSATRLFTKPVSTYDFVPGMYSSWYAMDALQAVLKGGIVVPTTRSFYTGTHNPGSIKTSDRTDESSADMIVMALGAIGIVQNYEGAPNTSYLKTVSLPWTTSASVESDENDEGCAYAGSFMSFFDAAENLSSSSSGTFKTVLTQVSALKSVFDYACYAGCKALNVAELAAENLPFTYTYATTGCDRTTAPLSTSDCITKRECPLALRHRSKCSNESVGVTDATVNEVSCAAAGIINLMNNDTTYGWN